MAQEISLVGTWRLVSFAVRPEVGEPVFPFGQDADGCITYADGGRFSVQIRRRDRPRFIEPDQLKGSPSEIEASFKGYIAYYGTYHLDAEQGTVTHVVEGSLFPNWEATEMVRFVKLSGDRVELRTPPMRWGGSEIVAEILWQRY